MTQMSLSWCVALANISILTTAPQPNSKSHTLCAFVKSRKSTANVPNRFLIRRQIPPKILCKRHLFNLSKNKSLQARYYNSLRLISSDFNAKDSQRKFRNYQTPKYNQKDRWQTALKILLILSHNQVVVQVVVNLYWVWAQLRKLFLKNAMSL